MSEQKARQQKKTGSGQGSGSPDLFDLWRQWLDRSERQMNTVLNEVMGSPQFNQAQARMMETFLQMQSSFGELTQRQFSLLNLPTRTDILELGERLREVDERLARLEEAVAALDRTGPREEKRPRKKPRRTKKPPSSREDAAKDEKPKKVRKKKTSGRKKTTKRTASQSED